MDHLTNYLAPSTSKQLQNHKHFTDLTAWATAAVDNGFIVGPDEDAPVGYVARNKEGKIIGRYSYMAGDTGPYQTGSLPIREDAGAGGISAGAVSGGPITHSDFAPVIGPKPKLELLRKARKKRKVVAETIVIDGQIGDGHVTVYKNPSSIELRTIRRPRGNMDDYAGFDVACCLLGDDAYFWVPPTYHSRVVPVIAEKAGVSEKTAIPLRLWFDSDADVGDENETIAFVTDYSRRTDWFHNPATADAIENNRYLREHFRIKEVDYFDADVVGNWATLVA